MMYDACLRTRTRGLCARVWGGCHQRVWRVAGRRFVRCRSSCIPTSSAARARPPPPRDSARCAPRTTCCRMPSGARSTICTAWRLSTTGSPGGPRCMGVAARDTHGCSPDTQRCSLPSYGCRQRGEDFRMELSVSLRELYTGAARSLTIKRLVVCKGCKHALARDTPRCRSCGQCPNEARAAPPTCSSRRAVRLQPHVPEASTLHAPGRSP